MISAIDAQAHTRQPRRAGRGFSLPLLAVLVLSSIGVRAHQPDEHAHQHEHTHNDVERSGSSNTPSRLTVARALQRDHAFDDAAIQLALHVAVYPLDVEAQLLHADVLWHAGRLDEARTACVRVAVAGAPELAGYCAAQILIKEEKYERAHQIAKSLAPNRSRLPDPARQWALEISAEAAWRAGRVEEAAPLFEQALDFEVVPHSTKDAALLFRASVKR